MCGRYAFFPQDLEPGLLATIERINRAEREKLTQGDVHPGDTPPVILMQDGAPAARGMKWGMPLPDGSRLVINARSEGAEEKTMFAGLIAQNRCLLPASLYYEWKQDEAHTRMRISAGGVIYMAGLFRRSVQENAEWEFVVLTRAAAGGVAGIHDRMPLILPDRDIRRSWLRDADAAREILRRPPVMDLQVQADEPEQLDLFAALEI